MGEQAGVLVGVAIVVLLEHGGSGNQVQRWIILAPRRVGFAFAQPFEMLGNHRIHHAQERFVAGKKAMPPRQNVAFQKAFGLVFR